MGNFKKICQKELEERDYLIKVYDQKLPFLMPPPPEKCHLVPVCTDTWSTKEDFPDVFLAPSAPQH